MASLTKCLKRAGLEAYEEAILRGMTMEYSDLGKHEAAVEAVLDYIEGLINDANSLRSVPGRGAAQVIAQLKQSERRGEISPAAVKMTEWVLEKNPAVADDVRVEPKMGKPGVSAQYLPAQRVIELFAGSKATDGVVHELLHHMERMMPAKIQEMIRSAWFRALSEQAASAKGDAEAFFNKVLDFHTGGSQDAMTSAVQMLKDGKLEYNYYQYVNPSEYWAVNASDILGNRYKAFSKGLVARIRNWMEELIEKVKGWVGLDSKAPILEALDKVMAGNGGFQSDKLLRAGTAPVEKIDVAAQVAQPARQKAEEFLDTSKYVGKRVLLGASFTQDVADMAASVLPSVRRYMAALAKSANEKVAHEKRIDNILDSYAKLKEHERGTGDRSVNAFLRDSRRAEAWGYADNPAKAVPDPKLAARFNALSPAAQKVVKDIFQHGYDTLQEKQASVRAIAQAEYAGRMASAKDDKARASVEAQMRAFERRFTKLMSLDAAKPYVPFKRFGNYVVVYSSPAYKDAVKNNDSAEISRLESDPNHRFVAFYDTMGQAAAVAKQLEAKFGTPVDAFEKAQAEEYIYGGQEMFKAFDKIRQLIKDQFGETAEGSKAVGRLNTMVTDLYLRTLAETTARKAEMQFKDIAGASDDMVRAFASQGRADAHYLAAIKHNSEITQSLGEMKKEAEKSGGDKAERMQYLNEFLLRHAANMEYKPTPVQNWIANVTGVWHLLTSPAYYLQNLSQPLVISAPYMSGKHYYGRTVAAMTKAYKELGPMLKDAKLGNQMDLTKVPADVREAIQELITRGRVDIGIEQDLGAWANGVSGGLSAKWGSLTHWLRGFNNKLETLNRLSTAIAAYRLELQQNGGNKAAAIDYADKVLRVTHGDYTSEAAPRYLKSIPLGKVITQFRRFQIMQISMLARLWHNSFHGEDKWAARKALGFIVAHQMALAGTLGVPAVSQMMWVFGALFGDDDEPNDPEAKLRQLIGDKWFADLLLKGLPAGLGVDVSGKVGMQNTFSLLPFANKAPTDRAGYADTLMQMSGPFIGGVVPSVLDGMGQIAGGDFYKGLETAMPSGVRNAMRGIRIGAEGVTNRNGDVLFSADEVSFMDAFAQAMGLPTTKITTQQFVNRTKIEYDQFYQDRAKELKNNYVKAYNKGDTKAAAAAREEWMELQDARVRNGYKRQPVSQLLSAPAQAKRKKVVEGVQVDAANQEFVEALND